MLSLPRAADACRTYRTPPAQRPGRTHRSRIYTRSITVAMP